MKLYIAYCPKCDIGRVAMDQRKAEQQAAMHVDIQGVRGHKHPVQTIEMWVEAEKMEQIVKGIV